MCLLNPMAHLGIYLNGGDRFLDFRDVDIGSGKRDQKLVAVPLSYFLDCLTRFVYSIPVTETPPLSFYVLPRQMPKVYQRPHVVDSS